MRKDAEKAVHRAAGHLCAQPHTEAPTIFVTVGLPAGESALFYVVNGLDGGAGSGPPGRGAVLVQDVARPRQLLLQFTVRPDKAGVLGARHLASPWVDPCWRQFTSSR